MLNKGLDKLELLRIVDAVANEKSIDKELVIGSMESAIQKAALTKFGSDNNIEVIIDRESGDIKIQKVLDIVEKVEDPASYGAAFTKMKKAFDATDNDGVLELHEILAGGEQGVTHEVIVRSKSMASWLEGRNKFIATKDFQEFIASTRPYSEVLHVLTGSPVKFYNVQ